MLFSSSSEFFNRLHVAAKIEAFQAQLKEGLFSILDTIVAQMRNQAQDITEEAHAATLAPRMQLVKTILQEMRCYLNISCEEPPGADGPKAPAGPDGPLVCLYRLVLTGCTSLGKVNFRVSCFSLTLIQLLALLAFK